MRWVLLVLWAVVAGAQPNGCESGKCHVGVEQMHASPAVHLACTDCHGGRADTTEKAEAHVQPQLRDFWPPSGNAVRSYTALNRESPEFIRFMNPGDLRVANETCGAKGCHLSIVQKVRASL